MTETPEAIKARMKVYDKIGTPAGYGVVVGLCGMAVCGIWQAPSWAFSASASFAAVGGILVAFLMMMYSGAKALLRDAEKTTKTTE